MATNRKLAYVYPDPEWFSTFHRRYGSLRVASKELGVSESFFKKCLSGTDHVQVTKLVQAAARIKVSPKLMTRRPPASALITKGDHYAGVWHSVYLDYDRENFESDERAKWWRETITFNLARQCTSEKPYPICIYDSRVVNEHGMIFEGAATLFNSWHLSVTGLEVSARNGAEPCAIVLSFTERVFIDKRTEVLVGTWAGSDRFNNNARLFRNFMCRKQLESEQIRIVSKRAIQLEVGSHGLLGRS